MTALRTRMLMPIVAVLVWLIALLLLLLAALLALLGDRVATCSARLSRARRARGLGASQRDHECASIIIVNWNGRDLLERCLPSVVDAVQHAGGQHELIVIDNGSSDGSVAYLRAAFPAVKVIALADNQGFSRGNNAAVAAAAHDIVVLLNNDMRVDRDFLAPLLAPFSDERVFAVSAQIHMGDPSQERVETGLTRGEMRDGLLHVWHAPVADDDTAVQPCLWAGGGSGAFDRRRFLALGGFHPLYAPFYVEDVDLSYRAWRRGWSVLFAPQSHVYHHHRASTGRFGHEYVERALAKNQRLFVWHDINDIRWTVRSLARLVADLAAALRTGDAGARQTLLWALRQMPEALAARWAEVFRRQWAAERLADRAVFDSACSRFHYRERFEPPPALSRSARKRILVLCPYLPVPLAHGGAVRMLNLIKNLSLSNDVDVLSFIDSEDERAHAPQLAPHCRRLRLVLRRPTRRYDPWRDRSWHIEEFASAEMQAALHEMLCEEDYHVLQIEYTQMAQYLPRTRRCLTALDEVDLTFRSFYRRQIAGQERAARQDWVDYLKIVRFEVESCRRFDRVLAMSADDASCLASYLPERRDAIVEIANGVDTSYYTPAARWPGGSELLFIGSHRHTPNQDGMRWFLRDVFPLIQLQRADAHLTIVGDGPWAEMPEIADNPAVSATGFVEDTRPYLARCAVSVVPILSGAGTRIKILDSLAAGIPVVSTTVGCEGIAALPDEDVLIANSPAAMATAVLRVLGDAQRAETLRRNGRRLVEQRYDWRAIVQGLDALYTSVLERRR